MASSSRSRDRSDSSSRRSRARSKDPSQYLPWAPRRLTPCGNSPRGSETKGEVVHRDRRYHYLKSSWYCHSNSYSWSARNKPVCPHPPPPATKKCIRQLNPMTSLVLSNLYFPKNSRSKDSGWKSSLLELLV